MGQCKKPGDPGTKKQHIHPGERFGKLTVIADSGERQGGSIKWICRCDCGNEIILPTFILKSNRRRSCGCDRVVKPGMRDITGERFGRLVAIEPTGNVSRTSGAQWRCRCDCGKEVVTNLTNLISGIKRSCGCYNSESARKRLMLTEDTSIKQLELATSKMYAQNNSGYRGVSYHRQTGKWSARARFQKVNYSLGLYDRIEDAADARRRFEEETIKPFIERYYERQRKLEAADDGQSANPTDAEKVQKELSKG